MLKRQEKHIDKEQGKTKHEAPRSVKYRATQNKNNIGTTALERSVVYTTGWFKGNFDSKWTGEPMNSTNREYISETVFKVNAERDYTNADYKYCTE